MILAAGLGTRLRPLTYTMPKPLLRVAGQPLIVWNLLLLRRYGVRDVIINLHHLGHLIEKELGDGAALGMRLEYSHETVLLGTGGGLKQAEWFFQDEPVLVLNGDTLLELDLEALRRCHEQHGPLATMVVRDDADVGRWGALEIDAQQRVLRINGRGRSSGVAVRRRMFAGVHIIHPRLLCEVPAGEASSIIDAYVREIARGETVLAHEMTGYWSDVGTPQHYADAQRDADAGVVNLGARL